jgi:hypothetical protein
MKNTRTQNLLATALAGADWGLNFYRGADLSKINALCVPTTRARKVLRGDGAALRNCPGIRRRPTQQKP